LGIYYVSSKPFVVLGVLTVYTADSISIFFHQSFCPNGASSFICSSSVLFCKAKVGLMFNQLSTTPWRRMGGGGGIAELFLTSAQNEGEWSA
jgi:hypothetical protein